MRWASGDGVSPSKARSRRTGPGSARYGAVGRSGAGRGKGCDGSTEGLRAFPAAFIGGQGEARTGEAMHGWAKSGLVRCAMAGQGSQTVARRLRPPCHPHKGWIAQVAARCREVRRGQVRHGAVRPDLARVADSSKELLRGLPAALFGGQIWRGLAWQAWDGRGRVWQCAASRGMGRQRRQGEAGQPAFSCAP